MSSPLHRSGYEELIQLDEENEDNEYDQQDGVLSSQSRLIDQLPDTVAFPEYPERSFANSKGAGQSLNCQNPDTSSSFQSSGSLSAANGIGNGNGNVNGASEPQSRLKIGQARQRSSFSQSVSRWTQNIADTYNKIGGRRSSILDYEPYEIYYSVFRAPQVLEQPFVMPVNGLLDCGPTTQCEFNQAVKSAITAMDQGIEPNRISQGSSGSYFMYNSLGKIVGVFKPKDEEPYGPLSPKWTKWIHRNLFPCFFGRSCLIPNNGYICEAAACTLDRLLMTYIVPFTDTVFLSSPKFYYNYFDLQRAKNGKPLPPKVGSFQLFLHGYEQANIFFQKYPLPDTHHWTNYLSTPSTWSGSSSSILANNNSTATPEEFNLDSDQQVEFKWTPQVLRQFREELEKLVILDYIMRNTDRGLDNWMIKLDWELIEGDNPFGGRPLRRKVPRLRIGAIDSGLSFPWKHPDEWRSYPFGWLFLPLEVIGQPFSKKTKDHFLPLLCSTTWWQDTTIQMKEMFKRDTEFNERLWRRQLAVLKGQAFNVVETLKSDNQGPLELARRTRVLVWNDESEVPVTKPTIAVANAMETPLRPQPQAQPYYDHPMSTSSPFRGGRARSGSLLVERKYRELKDSNTKSVWQDLVAASTEASSSFAAAAAASPSPPPPPPPPPPGTTTTEVELEEPEGEEDIEEDTSLIHNTRANYLANNDDKQYHSEGGFCGKRLDDTGFYYAEGCYASKRVIVERNQTVTSKPPIFTWC